jgi:prepilin signal peptidase PulO-like enzyme (type II secretory pathway)
MIPFFLFIFGLIIGSFLNVVIYRLNSGEGIVRKRSNCPHCRHQLGWSDLIPVLSFIFLKGRCRYCQKSISWQYPLVELFTALIFVLGYLIIKGESRDLTLSLSVLFIFSSFLIVIFVYDFKHYLILDRVVLSAFGVALILNLLSGKSLINLLTASGIAAGFFLLQFVVSRGKWIGGGDLRLGLVMGAMLGWPNVLVALSLAYLSGAVIGLALIVFRKKKLDSQIPFGTFLTAATLATLLWGEPILNWYLNYLGR